MKHKHYVTRREKRRNKRFTERLRKFLERKTHVGGPYNRLTRKRARKFLAQFEHHHSTVIGGLYTSLKERHQRAHEPLVCNHAQGQCTAGDEGWRATFERDAARFNENYELNRELFSNSTEGST